MQILQLGLIILFFLCCAVLVFLILIQSGKGGSLGIFGGAGSSTPFGASTVDVVTKATWYGTVAFFSLALLSAWAFADSGPRIPDGPAGLPGASELPGVKSESAKTAPTSPVGAPAAGSKNAPAKSAGPTAPAKSP